MALLTDHSNFNVLVKRIASTVAFPRILSPEIPHSGTLMTECFSEQLFQLTGTRYKLLLLYSSINAMNQRHLQATIPRAIFECLAPENPHANTLVAPANSDYQWMKIEEMNNLWKLGLSLLRPEDAIGSDQIARAIVNDPFQDSVRPWERTQWFTTTCKAALAVLEGMGYRVNGHFEQYHVTPNGAILRVNTSRGRVYLKANGRTEVETTGCIASFAPYVVAKPLHLNREGGWMLMEDYGTTLEHVFSLADYRELLILHGRLQVESMRHLKELEKIGLIRESHDKIMCRMRKAFGNKEIRDGVSKLDEQMPICATNKAEVTTILDVVAQLLKILYVDLKVPLSLTHGDLHRGNIIRCNGEERKYVIYDWDCAKIDIPFSDAKVLQWDGEVARDDSPETFESYLKLWGEYGSVEELKIIDKLNSLKDNILMCLEEIEYAERKKLQPRLDHQYMSRLHSTLRSIRLAVKSVRKS